jgi:hypothetical protein
MTLNDAVLLICLFFSLYGVGMIWFLQLNHYPLYASVGPDAFREYVVAHNRRLLLPVILPSLLAFLSSVALALCHATEIPDWSVWLVIAMNAVIAVSTVLVQGPAHAVLARGGYSASIVRKVLATNWLRTAAWTANGALLTWMTALTMNC